MSTADLQSQVLRWYDTHARDLPWRRPGTSAWAVLVSEVMLQQTPVVRVLPAYDRWLARWPTPQALAGDPPGEAVRLWGRLGYPRRALRLHQAATTIVVRHGGRVPGEVAALQALPGIGAYTAAAVAVFGFGERELVLDTNVRRVLARAVGGAARPPGHVTAAERQQAAQLLPRAESRAGRWSAAVMELGALVCSARGPRCGECPIAASCRWRLAGFPAYDGPRARPQRYDGTDRQCRGRLLSVLRDHAGPVPVSRLAAAWDGPAQRDRALASLVSDGLVEPVAGGRYQLPPLVAEDEPGGPTIDA